MKKIFALLLALVLVVAGSSIAFAAEVDDKAAQDEVIQALTERYGNRIGDIGDAAEDVIRQLSAEDIEKIVSYQKYSGANLFNTLDRVVDNLDTGFGKEEAVSYTLESAANSFNDVFKSLGIDAVIDTPTVTADADGNLQVSAAVSVHGNEPTVLAADVTQEGVTPVTAPSTDEPESSAPSEDNKTDEKTDGDKTESPKTGDEFPVAATLCFVAAGGVLLAMAINKGRKVFANR